MWLHLLIMEHLQNYELKPYSNMGSWLECRYESKISIYWDDRSKLWNTELYFICDCNYYPRSSYPYYALGCTNWGEMLRKLMDPQLIIIITSLLQKLGFRNPYKILIISVFEYGGWKYNQAVYRHWTEPENFRRSYLLVCRPSEIWSTQSRQSHGRFS